MTTALPQPARPESDWTVETLRQHMTSTLSEMDRRYQERFEAQAIAISSALTSATRIQDQLGSTAEIRETIAHLQGAVTSLESLTDAKFVTYRVLIDSQADKVALALAAADKAVTKAETATEKRFEGVNEFRAQLTDQANTFMPRAEAEQRNAQNTEKIAETNQRLQELAARIDRGEGRGSGHADSTRNLVTIIGIVLTAITVVVGVYLATKGK